MATCLPSSHTGTAAAAAAAAAAATVPRNQHKPLFSLSYWHTTNRTISSRLNLRRPFPISPTSPNGWSGRCHATSPAPPSPPPESDPQESALSSGVEATLSRIQDTVQIFFAVLFWMSLFFWASAWDGRNNDRPNRGSRFRK